jgi:hypothetical protein
MSLLILLVLLLSPGLVHATSLEQVNTTSVQTIQHKTLDSTNTLDTVGLVNPVITGTITGTYTLGGNAIILNPTFNNPVLSGSITGTYSLDGTVTINSPTITNPTFSGGGILGGTYTGTYTLAGAGTLTSPAITTPTITTPTLSGGGVLGGTYTGTYTLGGTPTVASPILTGTIAGSAILKPANGGTGIATIPTNGQLPIGNGTTYVAALPTVTGNGLSLTAGSGTLTVANTGTLDGARGLLVKPTNPSQGSFVNATNTYTVQAGTTAYNLFDGTATDGFIVNATTTFTAINVVIYSTTGAPTTIVYETCQSGVWTAVVPTGLPAWNAVGFIQVTGIPTTGWTTGGCSSNNVPTGSYNLRIRQTVGTKTVTGRASFPQFHDTVADEVIASDTTGAKVRTTALAFTTNLQCTGSVNCLDTGSVSTNTFYYLWAIYSGAQWGGLYSLSSTAPTMPTGYTFKLLLGVYKTDANSLFPPWKQRGARVVYEFKPVKEITAGMTNLTLITPVIPDVAKTWVGMATNGNAGGVYFNDVPFVSSNTVITFQYSMYQTTANVSWGPAVIHLSSPQTVYGDSGGGSMDVWTLGYDMPGNLH